MVRKATIIQKLVDQLSLYLNRVEEEFSGLLGLNHGIFDSFRGESKTFLKDSELLQTKLTLQLILAFGV